MSSTTRMMAALGATPSDPQPDHFPRWVLWCAAGILGFSLVSVAAVRLTGNGPDQIAARLAAEGKFAADPMAAQRPLRFSDRPDGGVAVTDARTGEPVAEFHGEQGFVRGALRALVRERKARGIGDEKPFQLMASPDGRLTLLDPMTGQKIELGSFGPTNAGGFAKLLKE
jgi:putative photosynthetic complex assembly protein